MGKTFAQLETKSADLATDFGVDWATKLFGAEALASLPLRASGRNKGKPKGFVIWRKATVAGYCREVQSPWPSASLRTPGSAWVSSAAGATR